MKGLKVYKIFLLVAVATCYLVMLSAALPYGGDQEERASDDYGRVQIKVYRGPTDEREEYAPWGFWVKQPAEEDSY